MHFIYNFVWLKTAKNCAVLYAKRKYWNFNSASLVGLAYALTALNQNSTDHFEIFWKYASLVSWAYALTSINETSHDQFWKYEPFK